MTTQNGNGPAELYTGPNEETHDNVDILLEILSSFCENAQYKDRLIIRKMHVLGLTEERLEALFEAFLGDDQEVMYTEMAIGLRAGCHGIGTFCQVLFDGLVDKLCDLQGIDFQKTLQLIRLEDPLFAEGVDLKDLTKYEGMKADETAKLKPKRINRTSYIAEISDSRVRDFLLSLHERAPMVHPSFGEHEIFEILAHHKLGLKSLDIYRILCDRNFVLFVALLRVLKEAQENSIFTSELLAEHLQDNRPLGEGFSKALVAQAVAFDDGFKAQAVVPSFIEAK